jgi:hypothetical protein
MFRAIDRNPGGYTTATITLSQIRRGLEAVFAPLCAVS